MKRKRVLLIVVLVFTFGAAAQASLSGVVLENILALTRQWRVEHYCDGPACIWSGTIVLRDGRVSQCVRFRNSGRQESFQCFEPVEP